MTNFSKRTDKGTVLMNELKFKLIKDKVNFYETGAENFKKSNKNIVNDIRKNNDLTSNFIRYFPDLTIILNEAYLIEVKYSSGIEKSCYENLIGLENNGYNILIYRQDACFCKPSELAFKLMEQYDTISKINIPVDDFIWRNPTKLSAKDYKIYIDAYKNQPTSGNIFAYFNYDKMKMNVIPYETFIKKGRQILSNIDNDIIVPDKQNFNLF
jgi:hypothetical protein